MLAHKISTILKLSHLKPTSIYLFRNQMRAFCTEKPPQNEENKKKTHKKFEQLNEEQQNQIVDQIFYKRFNFPENYTFKNDLMVATESYKKSTKQLREAILFEDLLKSEQKILIYDTKGKPFNYAMFKTCYFSLMCFGAKFSLFLLIQSDPRLTVMFTQMPGHSGANFIINAFLCFVLLRLALNFTRMKIRYIEKIMFDTQTDNFIFTRRTFYGTRYEQVVSRYKILYTQNKLLNLKGTNYINIDTKDQYFIGTDYAWKKQDLFSHLISQRIG